MEIRCLNWRYDASITEDDLSNDYALAWCQTEMGLSREDLKRLFARAKEIVAELKATDILTLTYDVKGAWFVTFNRKDGDGEWYAHIIREENMIKRHEIA